MSFVGNSPTDKLLTASDIDPNFILPLAKGGTGGIDLKTINSTSIVGTGNMVISGTPTLVLVSSTTQVAISGNHYVLENAGATTVTLPAGTSGDVIWVTVANARVDNVINVTTSITKINNDNTNMTIDNPYATIKLRHCGATSLWRIV